MRLTTGDWVGSAWRGPEWTPYAQAIADYYPIQVPWFLTLRVNLPDTGAALPRVTQVTRPYQHDMLIFGMAAVVTTAPFQTDNGNFIYLNITHQETGIPWVAPNTIGYSPLPAFAGVNLPTVGPSFANLSPMPILKLPEAFFLPRHTVLKLDWTYIFSTGAPINRDAILTMVGVQLIDPTPGFKPPERIAMPNGEVIPVGARLPWFGTIPFGGRQGPTRGLLSNFQLPINQQLMQFLPPIDCNVEIHNVYANFLVSPTAYDQAGGGFDASFLTTKLTDMRAPDDWTPGLSPSTAVFGAETQVDPAMPFTKSHLLKVGHRTAMAAQNNATAVASTVQRGTVTFRGVRLCEY